MWLSSPFFLRSVQKIAAWPLVMPAMIIKLRKAKLPGLEVPRQTEDTAERGIA
jgi:hypothetical protein